MQFGIFDQNDRGPYQPAEQYENRLRLIEFYDTAGFRTYHMSEHHSTPLSLTPRQACSLRRSHSEPGASGSGRWFTYCPPTTRFGWRKKSACWTISVVAGSRSE